MTYDGRENTYTFEKDGRKHSLIPLKDEKIEEQASQKVLLVSGKEILFQMINDEVSFALTSKPRYISPQKKLVELPIEIQGLLKQHVDIIFYDFLNELHPVRSMS